MEQIVVGVDGSAGARKALGEAIREAQLRGAHLHIVCAWQMPVAASALHPCAAAWNQQATSTKSL